MNPSPNLESIAAASETLRLGECAAPRLATVAGDTSTSRLALAHALFCDGQLDRAWQELSLALQENPELAAAQHVKGVMLAGSDRLQEAIAPLELAIELDPDSAVSYLVLGRTLQKLGHHNRALEVTSRLLRAHPDHAEGHALHAEILHRLGRTRAAIASSRESCRRDPSQAQVRFKLATMLREEQLWEESLQEFDVCQQLAPNDADILMAKADTLLATGQATAAIDLYRLILTISPANALAYARIGHCFFDRGDLPSATSLLRTALLLDTKLVDAYHTLALIYQAMGHKAEADRMSCLARQYADESRASV
jgi:tetratricopeptide (TPR) repeat protein